MRISDIQKKISPIFRKYGIRRASVFGSISRGEATPQSDIDILVVIGKPMGLFTYLLMKREIENRLGKKIDLVTEKSINRFIRPHIIKDLHTIYER